MCRELVTAGTVSCIPLDRGSFDVTDGAQCVPVAVRVLFTDNYDNEMYLTLTVERIKGT